MLYEIWTTSPHFGDKRDFVAGYNNRGQATAKLRGLRRRAWQARSEMTYSLYTDLRLFHQRKGGTR